MRTLIVVDSMFGNTHRIAEAIARGVRAAGLAAAPGPGSNVAADDVRVVIAAQLDPVAAADVTAWRPDLLLAGGPTVSRRMRPELGAALDALAGSLTGMPAAAFDTRIRGSELLMGSAAKRATDALRKAGARIVAPKESFYVANGAPQPGQRRRPEDISLDDGEEARAEAWGRVVATAIVGELAGERVGERAAQQAGAAAR